MRRLTKGIARVVIRLSRSLEVTFNPVAAKSGCSAERSSSSLPGDHQGRPGFCSGAVRKRERDQNNRVTLQHQPALTASPSEKL